jgi:hypothetical protein
VQTAVKKSLQKNKEEDWGQYKVKGRKWMVDGLQGKREIGKLLLKGNRERKYEKIRGYCIFLDFFTFAAFFLLVTNFVRNFASSLMKLHQR